MSFSLHSLDSFHSLATYTGTADLSFELQLTATKLVAGSPWDVVDVELDTLPHENDDFADEGDGEAMLVQGRVQGHRPWTLRRVSSRIHAAPVSYSFELATFCEAQQDNVGAQLSFSCRTL